MLYNFAYGLNSLMIPCHLDGQKQKLYWHMKSICILVEIFLVAPTPRRHRVLQKGWEKMIAFVSALEIFILPVASSLQQIKGSADWQQRVLKWQLWERHPWSRLFIYKSTWPLLTSIHTLETGDCDFGYSFWLIKVHWCILH